MAIFVEGVRGSGKSKIAVREIQTYFKLGRRVATNLDIDPEVLCPNKAVTYTRLPDIPRSVDLQLLGKAYPELDPDNPDTYDESKFGLIVIDELLVSFNSRNWNDKDRLDVVSWFVQSRKMGWRVWLLCQDVDAVDKQLRETLLQEIWHCRSGRNFFSHPILSKLFGFITKPLMSIVAPMGFHILTIYTGKKKDKINVAGREFYKLYDLHKGYKTSQQFLPDTILNKKGELIDMRASYTRISKSYFDKPVSANKTIETSNTVKPIQSKSFREILTSTPVLFAAFIGSLYFSFGLVSSSEPAQSIETTLNQKSEVSEPTLDKSQSEPINPLKDIFVSCSVRTSVGGSYCFETSNGDPFYPEDLGYAVSWYRPCLAVIVDGEREYKIKCSGKRRESESYSGEQVAQVQNEKKET